MEVRPFGKTGLMVPRLGFGMRIPCMTDGNVFDHVDFEKAIPHLRAAQKRGIRFFDTMESYYHGEGEIALGRAMKEGSRSGYIIQSKVASDPHHASEEEYRKRLHAQLDRLDCDYLDIELMHNLHWSFFEKHGESFLAMAFKAQGEGILKHFGFSSHDTPENVHRIIDLGVFECMLVQYNLVDQKWEECIQHAHESGLGVAVMGPVGGGRLGQAVPELQKELPGSKRRMQDLALRYVLSNAHIDVALSGMQTAKFLVENLRIADDPSPLAQEDYGAIRRFLDEKKALVKLYCPGCSYCMPCKQGVEIPKIFEYLIAHQVYGMTDWAKGAYAALSGKASLCNECGLCEKKCPQRLEIRKHLGEAMAAFEKPAQGLEVKGFYADEGGFRWMSQVGEFHFHESKTPLVLRVSLRSGPFSLHTKLTPTVDVHLGGEKLGTITFESESQDVSIDIDIPSGDSVVTFVSSGSICPADLGNSHDRRILSILMNKLQVVEPEADRAHG